MVSAEVKRASSGSPGSGYAGPRALDPAVQVDEAGDGELLLAGEAARGLAGDAAGGVVGPSGKRRLPQAS